MRRLEKLLAITYPSLAEPQLEALILKNCATLREVVIDIRMPAPAEGQKYESLEKLTCGYLPDEVRVLCPVLVDEPVQLIFGWL